MLSKKQSELLRWPYTSHTALICDGAVRSGKTSIMSLSFILWAMGNFNNCNFGLSGKTVGSAERNIIQPLLGITYLRKHFNMSYSRSTHQLLVSRGNRTNRFYVFGGRDESSYMLIQGVTLAGIFLDEVALMPRSFVEQAMARCSVAGRKIWFSCNPEGPEHWFYKEWVLKADEKDATHLHFTMDDNPALAPEIIAGYKMLYTGVFYRRYILGEWCVAEGLVYEFDKEKHVTDQLPDDGQYYISCDYGTLNPFSAGLWCVANNKAVRIREYYHSGRDTGHQMTDEEYYAELVHLADGLPIEHVVVDPSAASFIETIRRHGQFSVRNANNDVLDGIRLVSMLLRSGRIQIHSSCVDAIREFGLYSWDDRPDKTQADKPLKVNDHAMDDIRYFCMTVMRRKLRSIPELRGVVDNE